MDIFISYSTKDKVVADDVCSALENSGIKCWIAPRNIQPGTPYARAIINGITSAKIFLLVLTPDSNDSEHVINEVDNAFNAKKTIIPFFAEEVALNPELGYYLARKHWFVAYPDYKQKLENLVDTICGILGIPKKVVEYKEKEDVVKEQKKDNINIDGFQKFLDTANVLPSDEETNKSESEKTVGLDIENPAQPCKSPVKWMDFAQFCDYNGYSLKKMMFFTYTKTIALISWLGVVGSILSCAIICGVILDSRDPAFEFWNNFTFVIFIISFVTALTFSILRKFSCQLNPKVLCDIQDNPSQFKLIRNKNGLIGISMWWNKRCKLLLRMVYDNILCINDDTFICIHKGSYGIYNATKKKMVVPVEYDSIEYKNGKIYASSRDGVVSVYTDTGYRVVE